MFVLNLVTIALAGYLLGSVPSSIWIAKKGYGIDIREHGSGNAGGTNVFRVLGWKPALIVGIFDIGKGFVATFFFSRILFAPMEIEPVYLQLLAGCSAVLGHCYTAFAGFRGGKGVATAGGMLIAIFPTVLPICLLVFVIVVLVTRYVSLASMSASVTLPIGLMVLRFAFGTEVPMPLFVLAFVVPVFIFYTHRANIGRLSSGTENKIGSERA